AVNGVFDDFFDAERIVLSNPIDLERAISQVHVSGSGVANRQPRSPDVERVLVQVELPADTFDGRLGGGRGLLERAVSGGQAAALDPDGWRCRGAGEAGPVAKHDLATLK